MAHIERYYVYSSHLRSMDPDQVFKKQALEIGEGKIRYSRSLFYSYIVNGCPAYPLEMSR